MLSRVLACVALVAFVIAVRPAVADPPTDVVRLEGRVLQPNSVDLSFFVSTGSPATGHLQCPLETTYSTGERYKCGTKLHSYEILHTFGDSAGAAIMYFEQSDAAGRAFFSCNMREEAAKLAAFECDRQPEPPAVKSDEELISPIEGSVSLLSIANAQQVDGEGYVFRSMEPKTELEYAQLKDFGIDTVLILRKELNNAVQTERDRLNAEGIAAVQIPLDWKDYASFEEPCEQTIDALKLLFKLRAEKRKVLFHCTIGEDRTGYLAALFRLLTEKRDAKFLFFEEMCERGYDLGDATKPYTPVVLKLRKAVTVLYIKMAERIRRGEISVNKLDANVCRTDIPTSSLNASELTCETSTRFRAPKAD